ncbi:MAG: phosphoribosylformylglycinamidine cyclo-ligase [Dehalococcoidia bacterium]|nr:phosphoribosylformylglycinamidine cyclo-ligase [Dehalococcoidia bacterium]
MKAKPRGAYASSGVDVNAADKIKKSIAQLASSSFNPSVLNFGSFGSAFQFQGYNEPILVSSTDGVGTKTRIASLFNKHDTIGMDIVNHCTNDILCCGAKPLFFLDYIAMEKLMPLQVEAIVRGLAQACIENGCALIGGETAEMPGVYREGCYDLAGFIVGVVEKRTIIDGHSIAPGDIVLGLPSSGLHTNGYSLARKVFGIEDDPSPLNKVYPELGKPLGEELLQAHLSYYNALKNVLPSIKGLAHITGGGFEGNVPRILPQGLAVELRKSSWEVPPIFKLIQEKGDVNETEMYRVFNMGIGMAILCSPEEVMNLTTTLPQAKIIGEATRAKGGKTVIIS